MRFDGQDSDEFSRWESERQGSQDSTTKDSGIDTSSTFTSSEDSNRGDGPKVVLEAHHEERKFSNLQPLTECYEHLSRATTPLKRVRVVFRRKLKCFLGSSFFSENRIATILGLNPRELFCQFPILVWRKSKEKKMK